MTFKPLDTKDITNTRTLLHEAVPITGTILSGTYGAFKSEGNIKNYAHGMFQSVFDYPFLSSSANHIFDITVGVNPASSPYTAGTWTTAGMKTKKKNIYNQMAQVLMGYDYTGSVLPFDQDGDIVGGGQKLNEVFVLPIARLLAKDEIKKETFSMQLAVDDAFSSAGLMSKRITISDVSASTQYRVNSPVGEYGILYATASSNEQWLKAGKYATGNEQTASIGGVKYWYAGLIFYQAGVIVLSSSILGSQLNEAASPGIGSPLKFNIGNQRIHAAFTSSAITGAADNLRHRIYNMQFNNTTELNSTVYFCRANHNEFNYSSNPTYLSKSKIRVKTIATDNPVAYITSVGLYSDNNELMATAKLSEPLKKTPDTEFTIRVRLDY